MGIGPLMLPWFDALHKEHALFDNTRIADLGPQGLSRTGGAAAVYKKFPSGWWARDLYLSLGARDYRAFDLLDERAVKCDFNDPPQGTGDFDVVTNFGTSEHVFNQAAIMRFMHELLKPGGIVLHVVPAAGGRDHGFFNYHPSFFWDLARCNGYEVLDLRYVPHYALQSHFPNSAIDVDLKRHTDYKKLRTFSREASIKKATFRWFATRGAIAMNLRTVLKCVRHPKRRLGPFFDVYRHGDYLHVALRKLVDQPFVNPIQGMYVANEEEN